MVKVLVDTSVFIEYSRTEAGILEKLFTLAKSGEIQLITSSLVLFEFWSGKSLDSKKNLLQAQLVFSPFITIDCDEDIAYKAGELRRRGIIDDIDALIAATTLLHADYLATLNTKHFKKVPGLKLWQPEN